MSQQRGCGADVFVFVFVLIVEEEIPAVVVAFRRGVVIVRVVEMQLGLGFVYDHFDRPFASCHFFHFALDDVWI